MTKKLHLGRNHNHGMSHWGHIWNHVPAYLLRPFFFSIITVYFPQEVQILRALVLGEEERGQSQYQVMCFITHVFRDDFISSDAISKLRQVRNGLIFGKEK